MSERRQLIPVFIPPLVSLLSHAEEQKGSPLTEAEVLEIRGRGICMMMSEEHAHELSEKRGPDIDPEICWKEWQRMQSERRQV